MGRGDKLSCQSNLQSSRTSQLAKTLFPMSSLAFLSPLHLQFTARITCQRWMRTPSSSEEAENLANFVQQVTAESQPELSAAKPAAAGHRAGHRATRIPRKSHIRRESQRPMSHHPAARVLFPQRKEMSPRECTEHAYLWEQ